ncbi:electron transfer flavoprotein subunit beta/FixA family protein [Rhodothermus marinus]|uniref:electron transfer flavoprotein subunit beta/FixA family protein n=1 Tax=Rhodothermus marinus TaxID=29549 RepID=UPI0037C72254
MNICVCIKQVPDIQAPFRIVDGRLQFDVERHVLNAYDASAVEGALQLVEQHGGTVAVVAIGPASVSETIRKALAMGAERAYHIEVDPSGWDSATVATVLAAFFRDRSYDAIFTGKQAQDTDAGLTGTMLAERLGLPYVSNAVGLACEDGRLIVTRQGDAGREIIELTLPGLVTISNDMNDPRIPSIRGIMQARRKPVERLTLSDLGLSDDALRPQTRVTGYRPVPPRAPGRKLEGEPAEVVRELVRLLREEARVL